jgi:hypothetical protein
MIHGLASIQFNRRWLNLLQSRLPSPGACLALVTMVLVLTVSAIAQLDTGSISGVVTDPAGKMVQGAAVMADETTTGTTYSTTTSITGYYTFPSVHPGTYELKVSAAGFKNEIYTGVVVAVGTSSTRDMACSRSAQPARWSTFRLGR